VTYPIYPRKAFTLMELMLVMAILVILASIAVPILGNVLDRQKLRGAAEELRLAWDNARLKAMRTGQTQIFQCQIESGAYSIQPLILHDDVNNVGDGATLLSGGVAVETSSTAWGVTTSAVDPQELDQLKLDETVTFASCRVASDPRAFSLAQSGGSTGIDLTNVSQAVLFYSDGTTSTAEALIRNQRGDTTGVQLRGLTGHSKVLAVSFGEEANKK
jgi:prepilin-type N-terminal cleavage/methylation domain-containing protein